MTDTALPAAPAGPALPRPRLDRAELSGAVADLGVLLPIAVALIVYNGLSPTAVLLPAGLLYVVAGLVFRLPVPVQPLKAFGAIAIASGFGPDGVAAGALLMGLLFVGLGASGLIDHAARLFPVPIIRGVQLSVGLLFAELAWQMVAAPPEAFTDHSRSPAWLIGAGLAVATAAVLLRRYSVTLVLVALAVLAMVVTYTGPVAWGPAPVEVPRLDLEVLGAAAVALVLPQLPLTFANSCLATADVARGYFGPAAARVTPGRLAVSLGTANLLAGAVSGMPVCHGAGGMTAHRSFGARTGGAPIAMGSVLVVLALTLGDSLSDLLAGFPLPVLAGLLAVAGVLHVALLRDLRHPAHWALAVAVGVTGVLSNLAVALVGALVLWWTTRWVLRRTRGSGPSAAD